MQPVSGDELVSLIPQKPPFVMISKLINVDQDKGSTAFTVEATNVLCDNGALNTSGMIENIAQSFAAMSGYVSVIEKRKVPMGFIGDVRNFECKRLPLVGEEIITEITVENRIFDVTLISGKITLNGVEIASCQMKVFVKPEAEELFE